MLDRFTATTTDAAAAFATVTTTVALFPSLVAVNVATPGAAPVMIPLVDAVATLGALVVQATVRPVSVAPAASLSVKVGTQLCPGSMVQVVGERDTVATGGSVTVTVATALFPSAVAVTVAVPGATAVTTPVVETVAMVPAEVVHVTDRPFNGAPAASEVTALSAQLPPGVSAHVAGVMVTRSTGGGATMIVAVPFFPSLVTVMVAVPAATAVTTPAEETVAIALAELAQLSARPVSTRPDASVVVATSVQLAPGARAQLEGATVTVATDAGVGVLPPPDGVVGVVEPLPSPLLQARHMKVASCRIV